jgi:superfamily II DNA/RNA helicase/HKD family nuclease
MVHNDLTFFTNEPDRNLYERFNKILQSNTQFFDILVGYFRTSGFHLLHNAMKDLEKIRILVGLNVDRNTIRIIQQAKNEQMEIKLTHKEVKDSYVEDIEYEMQNSADEYRVEQGVKLFIEWLKSGKVEMRIYPDDQIHAKVYIMRKDMNKSLDTYGSVITGSSNFSQAGLKNNLEFNVELKDSRDVDFALDKFNELWEESVELKDDYINAIEEKTWHKQDITPYELFLKTLYEYFNDEINQDKNDNWSDYLPYGFMKLQYQTDAVIQAKKTLDAYGGVFIADVVGLGKTFICAMLAQKLSGGKLIICPPVLESYWRRTLLQFDVAAEVISLGKLDNILKDEELMSRINYVFIDEAHRFRNQSDTFGKLHRICYNKKVILVTATPQNNYSSDIANQIYLFQSKNNSTIIPNNKNIEAFFRKLEIKLKKCEKGTKEYSNTLKANSEIIRDQVLRNVMIRRTRTEIMKYYKNDLNKQGLKFPHLGSPEKIIYEYNDEIETVFNHTIKVIQEMSYSRYKPLTFLEDIKGFETLMVSQRNIGGFMKSVLIKRLESSFEAFKKTLNRFITSYSRFLRMCDHGTVYISKKYDVYDLLDEGDDERLMELVDEGEILKVELNKFNKLFIPSLQKDLRLLKELLADWEEIILDPKILGFIKELRNNPSLKEKKMIIFSESKETAEYVSESLKVEFPTKVLMYSGQGSNIVRDEIEANFNPNYKNGKKGDIQILVTTDVLAEGINLHRANVVINYDLPWNPTRVMQRVGRINRVGTEHDRIFVFNFFPTAQANAHLPLEQNILIKIQAFHDTLGEDFKYLSDSEEVSSHNIYNRLIDSLEEDEAEGKSELEYINIIRDIRDNNEALYEKIKRLPKKAKVARQTLILEKNSTISFIRKGGLRKFFISDGNISKELLFLHAMEHLQADENDKRLDTPKEYFEQLKLNKAQFEYILAEEDVIDIEKVVKRGNDASILKLLKSFFSVKSFTDAEELTIKEMIKIWEEGNIPSSLSKEIMREKKDLTDPHKIYFAIRDRIPDKYFENRKDKRNVFLNGDIEVVLSEYLVKGSK